MPLSSFQVFYIKFYSGKSYKDSYASQSELYILEIILLTQKC